MSRADWPLDLCLERLRAHALPYRGDVERSYTWWGVCPVCRAPFWTLSIREWRRGGAIVVDCSSACPSGAILAALATDPLAARLEEAELRAEQALALAEDAAALAAGVLAAEHLGMAA